MANPVDILIGKKAIEDFDVLIAKTIKAQEEILKLGNDALKASGNISKINTPSGVTANSNNAQNITASLNKQTEALSKTQAQIERLRVAEIKLQQQREKAVDRFTANEQKQQQALARSETAYQRIQSSVNLLTKTYQDLAIRRELGGTLTKREEAQLVSLTNRLNLYQTALKKVDADIQKNQRNVGNYASGWNGLGNSINQITRELPAFTFSAQTGFLALSNNIPILTDEIGKLQRANKELIAQGKPVTSVFSQILGGVFSLQTAMGVGILLFTLYGKQIGEFVTGLFKSKQGVDALAESTKNLKEIQKEGLKNAQQEIIQLRANLEIAKDVNLSYEQRMIAVKAVQEQYPAFLGNLSKEKILAGETAIAEEALTNAIISRAKAVASVTKITEIQSQIIDLEEKQLEITNKRIAQETILASLTKEDVGSSSSAIGLNANDRINTQKALLTQLKRQEADVQKEINSLNTVANRLTSYSIEEQKKAILLDTQKEGLAKKEKKDKRDKIEDIKLETNATNSLLDSLEEQIRLIKVLQQANSKTNEQFLFYQKSIDQLQKGIDLIKKGNQDLQKSAQEGIKGLLREDEIRKQQIERLKELQKATDEYIKSFSDSYLGSIGLSSLDKFFDGTFNRLMAGADTMQEKFAVTFLAITEVAKQAFAFINQASQANFDAEYSRLEMQKEVAIKFAGESTTAQEAVNEEYERRRKAIARREAESKKDLAIFNSIVNTAQGVTSALASANIPLAITIGILGAIQTGFIASQEIPQFFDGGTHKGGLMLVNDGKGTNYKETIVTPDGKVINPTGRNVLMDAPKGTQIFNANQTKDRDAYLQSFLQERGISMNFQPKEQNGISTNDFNNGISRLERTMLNSSSGSIVADKKGIALWKIENGRITKVLNNRLYVRK